MAKSKPAAKKKPGTKTGDLTKEHLMDYKLFEKLCGIQCTRDEIAAWFHLDDETLMKYLQLNYGKGIDFPTLYKRFSKQGLCSLRRKQWKLADTNAGMAIFLGKNLLDQSDQPTAATDSRGLIDEFLREIERRNDKRTE